MKAMIILVYVLMVSWVMTVANAKSPSTTPAKSTGGAAQPAGTTAKAVPFAVECANKTSATLTMKDTNHTLHGSDGCKLKQSGKGTGTGTGSGNNLATFTLDSTCLSKGRLIVEKVLGKGLVKGEKNEMYTVDCQEDGGVVMTVNSSLTKVIDPSGTPLTEHFTVSQSINKADVHLYLLTTDPATLAVSSISSSIAKTASLGQSLFLTLFQDNSGGQVNVIPLSCEASVDSSNKATLWQLHNSPKPPKECYYETEVVKSAFSQKNSTDNARIYVTEIEAFRFREKQDSEITFSCQVRVCSTGLCGQDEAAVASCGTNQAPPTHRRRRSDVGYSDLARGRVDHVTAKLRVIDGPIANGGPAIASFIISSLYVGVALLILQMS